VIKTKKEENKDIIENVNNEMLRYIITIGAGFAIGGIITSLSMLGDNYFYYITGLHIYFKGNYQYIHFIPFIIWGIIGGLSIGVITKKDKKPFMLFGGIGFGIGFAFSVFFNYWSDWSNGIGYVAGRTIGLLGGLSLGIPLGFYYRTIQPVIILSICGASGFAFGGLIGIMMYRVFLDTVLGIIKNDLLSFLIVNLTAFMVTGLIGGILLGLGAYYIIMKAN
jgi:hypothetical protein